ncbi:hypothetical protein DPMN_135799 [Dreissena polymorpha]|uniref:Uncharacterized protein n=1 Tax=Dreissena polymorpha TaxID=45954 RepID=A0A9D4FYF8_DREPO|nr:hypothetical protein DPMN_135799 [Dreissena polymorpha]
MVIVASHKVSEANHGTHRWSHSKQTVVIIASQRVSRAKDVNYIGTPTHQTRVTLLSAQSIVLITVQ